jgi:N6-L-threonylcarbamoyladenine synthase
MLVYILNEHGEPLMPCKPRKARLLLKTGKARVVQKTPFTIQLLYGSSGHKQPITLGVDSGFENIGLSAVSENRELFSSEIQLRDDIVKLNSERRQYRRARRGRKTRYRAPRFLNRGNKGVGWLAPSIQHKLDSHIKVINRIKAILPVSKTVVEVAAFDIQKIKNPGIEGAGYQQGEQSGFWNVREYVLHRDGHKCRHCKGKSKDPILNVHHIESRQTGGDRPENLATLCKPCHDLHHKGKIELKIGRSNGFKAETFMSMVRWKIVNQLRNIGLNVTHTYGYITKNSRIRNGIPKSHANDAFVIAGGVKQRRATVQYNQKQVRKCNRKLFKGIRSHIRNTAPRFVKGFQRFDSVRWNGSECFIFGRRQTGYFDLRKMDGTKVHASAQAKDCDLIESAKTLLIERTTVSSPA